MAKPPEVPSPVEVSSPACSMHEADDAYMGFAPPGELVEMLNEFLEAERAAVEKLRKILPRVRDDRLHAALSEMLRSHDANIARASEMVEPKG